MTSTPGGRAGHEDDRDFVDKDVQAPEELAREGEFVDKDVDPDAPDFEREGDFTDKDVTEADTDTQPRSFTAKDVD
jgi:hypothetical protein